VSDTSNIQAPSIQERILAVEERKVTIEERQQSEKENGKHGELLKANVAVLLAFLTSMVSFCIAYATMHQVDEREQQRIALENQRITLENNRFALDTSKASEQTQELDRKWRRDLLDFTVTNKALIFGKDDLAKKEIETLMRGTFPDELTKTLFGQLAKSERGLPPAEQPWTDAAKKAEASSPSAVLTSRVWKLRIVYGNNENNDQPSATAPEDIDLRFTRSGNGYLAWRVTKGQVVGAGSKVTVIRSGLEGQLALTFQRTDIGDAGSGVNCKRALSADHGALFELKFDPTNVALDGELKVARPDVGSPYKCADAQFLSAHGDL